MSRLSLKNNERIVVEIRRYGLTYVWQWFAVVILFGTPFFFMFWLLRHGWWGQALFFVPVTIGFVLLIRVVFMTHRNVTTLTTHRIVDVDQKGFFEKQISDVSYNQVEDVAGHVKGFFGTIFRYGNVIVETGSRNTQLELDRIKNPEKIQQLVKELRERYLASYSHEFSDQVADVIIEKLHELELPELLRIRMAVKKRILALKEKP